MFVPLIGRWAVESQQKSRRNAMLASTVLTQRRAERVEAEEYLAAHAEPERQPVAAHG